MATRTGPDEALGASVSRVPDLRPLFTPRSVAVFGASTRDPSKLGNHLLRNVIASALDDVVAISPTRGTAEGVPTTPSLAHPVDVALISVPAAAVEAAAADAAAAGTRSAVVLTSGFGETDGEGKGGAGADPRDRSRSRHAVPRPQLHGCDQPSRRRRMAERFVFLGPRSHPGRA